MGSRGPVREPTENLKRKGSWRAKTRNNSLKKVSGTPLKPHEMGDISSALWDYYEPILLEMGVLGLSDGLAFQMLCETFEQWYFADQWVKRNTTAIPVKDEKGNIKAIIEPPQVRQRERAQINLIRLFREFGLSPSSRSQIQVSKTGKVKLVESTFKKLT